MTPDAYPDDPCLTPPAICDPRVRFFHDDGVLFVTAAPPLPGTSPPASFVAVWRHHADARPYVFARRIYTHTDLGHALLRLETLLGVNRAQFTSNSSLLNDAVTLALAAPPDTTGWPLATHGAIAVALDFDPADISDPTFLLADDDHGGDLDSEDECHNNSFTTGLDEDYEFTATDLLILDDLAIELTYGVDCCGTSDCCDDNSQCAPNEHCVDGECLPDECYDDSDCDADEHCAGGTCVPDECDEINECPDGSHCEGGECVDNPCDDHGDCPSGQECIGGECEKPCNGDDDCPTGDECVGGVCEDCPGQCCDNDDCDDGNPCMADECRQGRCEHKCVAPCVRCQTGGGGVPYPGFCLDCACNLSLCDLSIQATPDPACAGGIVDLVVSVNCNPDCEAMTWMVVAQPAWAVIDWPDGNGGELYCDEAPQQQPLRAQLSCNAPETVEFIVYGETTLGTTCEVQCTIVVTQCVDLDVDSNNDGFIDEDNGPSGSDDPIEDELLSPSTPGKWLWRNNDDSDANTKLDNGDASGSETDAGVINGVDDLVDLPELIIRPIPASAYPEGSKLFLETSNANALRVFGCRTETCFQVILGPLVPQKVEIPFDIQQRTFALEGVQDGLTLTLSLILEDELGLVICSDTIRVTIIRLDLQWLKLDDTAITEVNDRPDPERNIGVRYFPDATAAGGSWNDKVKIQTQTVPEVTDVSIHLKAFDPDDPSADNNAVDPNDATFLGGDNKDADHHDTQELEVVQVLTNQNGRAKVRFDVAQRPGDNHRVAATMKQAALSLLNDDNVKPSGQATGKSDGQNDMFIGTLSPLLSVWRKLHVELDAMGPGSDPVTPVGRNIDKTDDEPGHGSHSWAEINGWSNAEPEGRLEGGTLTVAGGGNYEIVDNVRDAGDDTIYVQGSILADEDKLATATDDDAPYTPRKADISLMNVKFQPAYIVIEEDGSRSQLTLPFIANLTNNAAAVALATAPGRDGVFVTSHAFWTAQIVVAHQGREEWDHDPDEIYHFCSGAEYKLGENLKLFGQSLPPDGGIDDDNVSVMFLETIRDHAAWSQYFGQPNRFPSIPIEYAPIIEQVTVVHELGHVFGISADPHPLNGIMKAGASDPALSFQPEDLALIRASVDVGKR